MHHSHPTPVLPSLITLFSLNSFGAIPFPFLLLPPPYSTSQVVDILHGYVELGVMVQKPNAGGEKELREHYKVETTSAVLGE